MLEKLKIPKSALKNLNFSENRDPWSGSPPICMNWNSVSFPTPNQKSTKLNQVNKIFVFKVDLRLSNVLSDPEGCLCE